MCETYTYDVSALSLCLDPPTQPEEESAWEKSTVQRTSGGTSAEKEVEKTGQADRSAHTVSVATFTHGVSVWVGWCEC